MAKFLSVDPLAPDYSFYTPYQFAGNMPLSAVDLDGLEVYFAADGSYVGKWGKDLTIRVVRNDQVKNLKVDLVASNSTSRAGAVASVNLNFYWRGDLRSRPLANPDLLLINDVIPPSTNVPYRTDCYTACESTLRNNDLQIGSYWSPDNQFEFQMYTESNSPDVDIDQTRVAGLERLNYELEQGKPVLVGINHTSGMSNNENTDKTTDHFVLVTGRGVDENGGLYYTVFENVIDRSQNQDKSDLVSRATNRLYLNADGTLRGGTNFLSPNSQNYPVEMTVTQIRPVKDEW